MPLGCVDAPADTGLVSGQVGAAGVFRPLLHEPPTDNRSITIRGVQYWFAPCGAVVVPLDVTLVTDRMACTRCYPARRELGGEDDRNGTILPESDMAAVLGAA